jgi:hypothetical protein
MIEATAAESPVRWKIWTGRVLSAIPVLMMGLSALMKLVRAPPVVQGMTEQFGYPPGLILPIGVVELTCVVLYVIPQTAVLGAVLLTGYLGGAIATHVRISDPSFVGPLILGVMAWAGLYLREGRLRPLLPLRR